MGKESIKYIVLALLVFGMMAGTASATLFFNYTLNGTATTVTQSGNNVSLNFTIRDDTIPITFYNISFSNKTTGFFVISPGVNTSSKTNITATNHTDNIGNFSLLGDNAVWNVTNVSGIGAFVNVSFNASNIPTGNLTAANSEAFINITNITLPSEGGLYFFNLTTDSGVAFLWLTIDTTGPTLIAMPTGYGPSCGGYASDTCPYFTLNVNVTNMSTGVNLTNVTANVSRWNNTGFLVMNPNGTYGLYNYLFSLNVTVDKVVRGTYNATVTAYDNYSVSNTTNLSVEAHIQPGLSVIGYNSSKTYPAYPTYVSMFYNNSPVVMIINTTDATQYSNITVYFGGVDGSASVEYNNSGVLLPDGTNYTYRITHNLSTIPTNDVRTAWINATFTPPGGVPITIPQMAALILVSNVNPRDLGMGLGGITTNWSDIPDYTNASLTFEAVNATNNYKVATLRFNEPINLTNYATAQNLSLLGQKLSIASSSINLSGAADALIAFNKSANLTIYNLTTFTTSPAIFADGVLIALPDQSTGGAASDISWNQTAQSLTLNVSHWTSFSWGTFGINLTNISALDSTTTTATNATYTFILQNNGTLNDTYSLTIDNPDAASVAALNIGGNITLEANAVQALQLNVTNTTAGTYRVNVTATSVNFSNRTASINTTTTVTLTPTNGANLTLIGSSTQSVLVNANATYTFSLENNGTLTDNYTISVSNPNLATTGLNISITSPVMIISGATQIFTLNVSNASSGTFPVNITANSTNDPSKVSIVNTTTTVSSAPSNGTNLAIIGSSTQSVLVNTNATYVFSLQNNGSLTDNYTISVSNPNLATTGLNISITSPVMIISGATQIFTLNVSDASSGTFPVNITANSTNDPSKVSIVNTTTTVTSSTNGTNLAIIGSSTQSVLLNTNATYVFSLQNNGTSTDNYTISVSNPNLATTGLNISITSPVMIASGATQIFTLNVSSASSGTFPVNITANSTNDPSKVGIVNTTTTVSSALTNGTSLTIIGSSTQSVSANTNATYTFRLQNNGTSTDNYTISVDNPNLATFGLNVSSSVMIVSGGTQIFTLNVSSASSGTFPVNVTANSTNDPSKFAYINTTTTVPIVIVITNPANNSVNDTGYVNVNATLDANGTAKYLNWNGVNITMTPNTSQPAGTVFSTNMTNLLSGNYTFKVYANDSNGVFNVSDTRIVTVNRTIYDNTIGTIINTSTFITNDSLEIAAPSGNVTVTIPNGTNASVNGTALTTISVDSLAQVNSTFVANLGSRDTLIGENLSLGPEGAIFIPDIQLRFNYTDAELAAAGISESQLSVKFYNTTTNTWVTQTTYSQNTTGNYLIVNVSHFSTFALLGTTSTGGGSSAGGGGSTGGGGVVTGEPFDNIAKSESYDKDLIADTPVTYAFTLPELGVYEIAFTDKENENSITLRVEALKDTSKQVTAPAPGTVFKNVNIIAGTSRMKEALIRFRVDNSWLGSNNLAGSDVKMLRWDGSQWTQLETAQTTKDDTYTYYEAKTTAFSPFAISGVKGGVVVPTATPAGAVTETPVMPTGTGTPAPSPTKKVPAFEVVLAIAILSMAYLLGRKRR